MIKHSIFIIIGLLVLALSGSASQPGEKTVTYGNFSFIRDISASNSFVYFATTNGIIRLEKIDLTWDEPLNDYSVFDYTDISRIWADQFDNSIYCQTGEGYFEYDMLLEEWFPIASLPTTNNRNSSLSPPRVMYPPDGFNYTAEGFLIDPDGRDFEMNRIIDDNSGNWWLSFWGYGAAKSSGATNLIELLPYGLLQSRVDAIYNDKGILWLGGSTIGQYRTGLTIFNPDNSSFNHLESGIMFDFPDADIYCFASDKKNMYVGSSYGLMIFDKEKKKVSARFTKRSGLPDDYVYAVASIGDTLFVGTDNGLAVYKKKASKFAYVRPQEFVNVRINDFAVTDSSIWIASSNGVYQLHFDDGRLQKFQDPHNLIFSEALNLERFDHELWIASDNGILKLDLITATTTPFPSISPGYSFRPLAANDVIAVYGSDRGFTIIFDHYKEHPNIQEFSFEDGLPDTPVRALLLDGDFLWIGTDAGLTRFWWSNPYRVD